MRCNLVITIGALALLALAMGGCSGGTEVAERPADEPVRAADDVVPTFEEEEARAAEEAAKNP